MLLEIYEVFYKRSINVPVKQKVRKHKRFYGHNLIFFNISAKLKNKFKKQTKTKTKTRTKKTRKQTNKQTSKKN